MAGQNLGFWKQEITGQHLHLACKIDDSDLLATSKCNISIRVILYMLLCI